MTNPSHQSHHLSPVLPRQSQEPPQHLVTAQVQGEVLLVHDLPHLPDLLARDPGPGRQVPHAPQVVAVSQESVEGLETQPGGPLYLYLLQVLEVPGLGQAEEHLVTDLSQSSQVDNSQVDSSP